MSYIGNNLQTAFPSYLNIDDISGSFDGVTTSFPLTVGGVAPVPAPLSSNQCLISVGGVVQRPDDSGTEGFLLSGGNIVFSAAPAALDDFFGVILAGADYVNVGVNFPSGTATTPSITFDTDLDTGLYNPGANEIGFTTAGVNRLTIDSSGDVTIVNDLTVDTNTLHVDSTNNRVGIGTTTPSGKFQVTTGASGGNVLIDAEAASAFHSKIVNGSGDLIVGSRNASADTFVVSNRAIAFKGTSGETEVGRFDSSGRLLVGTSSARSNVYTGPDLSTPFCQIENNAASYDQGLSLLNYSGAGYPSSLTLGVSLSGTKGTNTLVRNNEMLGRINFAGNDGTNFRSAALIQALVDGLPGSGDMPGRLVFSTTADGASSPTERMRILSNGLHRMLSSTAPTLEVRNTLSGSGDPLFQIAAGVTDMNVGGSAVMRVMGDGDVENATGVYTSPVSDERFKTDIVDVGSQWNDIKNVKLKKFRYKNNPDGELHLGIIAQELEQVCPKLIKRKIAGPEEVAASAGAVQEGEEYLSWKASLLPLKAVKALQEAMERIEVLEQRLTDAGIA